VVGDNVNIPYNGILGKDFFESEQTSIDYTQREGNVAVFPNRFSLEEPLK
jgi:hypothetical protein